MTSADSSDSELRGGAGQACRDIGRFLEWRKNVASSRIAFCASLVRKGADWFEAEAPPMARAVRRGAETVEYKAQELRAKSLATLDAELGERASQKPFAFVGWGFLVGFVIARKVVGRGC
jgi:hypothetical protein